MMALSLSTAAVLSLAVKGPKTSWIEGSPKSLVGFLPLKGLTDVWPVLCKIPTHLGEVSWGLGEGRQTLQGSWALADLPAKEAHPTFLFLGPRQAAEERVGWGIGFL